MVSSSNSLPQRGQYFAQKLPLLGHLPQFGQRRKKLHTIMMPIYTTIATPHQAPLRPIWHKTATNGNSIVATTVINLKIQRFIFRILSGIDLP